MICAFGAVTVVAQNEEIHRAMHSDAGEPEHQCLATLVQSGQIEHSAAKCEGFNPNREVTAPLITSTVFHFHPPFTLLPNRGPPPVF